MKKLLCLILALLMAASLCACGGNQNTEKPDGQVEDGGITTLPEEDGNMSGTISGVPNPMVETSLEDLTAEFGPELSMMEQFEEVTGYRFNTENPFAQVNFKADGDDYCFRFASAGEFWDLSGMNYTWTNTSEAEVGYNIATLNLNGNGQGAILWYDVVPGILYSLSMSENANAEKLTAMANTLYIPTQGEVYEEGVSYDDLYGEFAVLVEELHGNYFPGTTGSSLVGSAYAARIADLFTMYPDYAAVLADMVTEYSADALIDPQDKASFAQQMAGINGCFTALSADGIAILDGADYEPTQYPWDTEAFAPLFDHMAQSAASGIYAPILEDAYNAVTGTLDPEQIEDYGSSMFYLLKDCTLDSVGFGYVDVDGDGVNELMLAYIGNDNEFMNNLVFGLYTADEALTAAPVFTSRERDRYYYAGGSDFAHVGSSGADDSFSTTERYENGALTDLETVTDSYVTPELLPLHCLKEFD